MYTNKQVTAVAKGLHNKLAEGSATEMEVLLTVLIMEKEHRININQVTAMLLVIFEANSNHIKKALENARNNITDETINSIITELHKDKPSE